MKVFDSMTCVATEADGPGEGRETVQSSSRAVPGLVGAVVGQLVAIIAERRLGLVVFDGQIGSAAVQAGTVTDLHGGHVGRRVLLMFEGGDPTKPIVLGVLHDEGKSAVEHLPGRVELSVDGERLLVTARDRLVLRCGKASITLTRAGKVLIEGTYVSSRSSGVSRLKGGSVQIN